MGKYGRVVEWTGPSGLVVACADRLEVRNWQDADMRTLQLLRKWRQTFVSIQEAFPEGPVPLSDRSAALEHLQRASGAYLAELWIVLAQIESDREIDAEYLARLYQARSIWLIVHYLYVLPNVVVTAQLVEWFHQYAGAVDTSFTPGCEDYWMEMSRRVLSADRNGVQELVSLDPSLEPLMQEVLVMLDHFPVLSQKEKSREMFDSEMTSWRDRLLVALSSADFSNCSHALLYLQAMSGEDNALIEAASGSWIDLFMGKLLFQYPQADRADIRDLVGLCRQVLSSRNDDPELDCIRSFLELDESAGLVTAYQIVRFPWFVSHLCDLLYHVMETRSGDSGGVRFIRRLEQLDGISLRQFFLLEHGDALLYADSVSWMDAIAYYSRCGHQGKERIRAALMNHPVKCESDSLVALDVSRQFNMPDVASSIAMSMGRRALQLGHEGSAIAWFLRAEADACVESVCNVLLDRLFSSSTRPVCVPRFCEFLDSKASRKTSFLLHFLVSVTEYRHTSVVEDRASLIMNILLRRDYPTRFYFGLLQDLFEAADAAGEDSLRKFAPSDWHRIISDIDEDNLGCVHDRSKTVPHCMLRQRLVIQIARSIKGA